MSIQVGDTFRCITHSLYTTNKDDECTVYNIDYISDQVEIRLHKNGQHVYVPLSSFNSNFVYCTVSLDSLMGYGLTPEKLCECGSEIVYGRNDDPKLHSYWCRVVTGKLGS